ncbi:MAG: RsiV family protein [Candidatus Staskawiczbacteria bacterium]
MSKKIILIVIAILIVLAVVGWFYPKKIVNILTKYPTSSSVAPEIKNVNVDETTGKYEVRAKYPEFNGSSAFFDLNNLVREKIQSAIDGFKADAEQNSIAEVGALSSIQIDYETFAFNDKIASIRFGTEYYIAGMAHPNFYYETLNYNLKDNKEIILVDLFSSGSDYLSVLSTISREVLKNQIESDYYSEDFVNPGTEPSLENFQVFNFTSDKLTITFNPYQVGPWVAGPQFVEIPFDQLGDITGESETIQLIR